MSKTTLKFWTGGHYEVPDDLINWQYSDTFGRYGAVVKFGDGSTVFTYPQDDKHPDVPRRQTSEQIKAQLLDSLRGHVKDWYKPWPGCEFAKTIIGNAIIGAARDHGATDADIQAILGVGPGN